MDLKVPWLLQHEHNSLNTDISRLFKHDLHGHVYTRAKCKCKLRRIIKKFYIIVLSTNNKRDSN